MGGPVGDAGRCVGFISRVLRQQEVGIPLTFSAHFVNLFRPTDID